MNERPILFSDPMVRAILSGQKVQTRRVVKPQPVDVSALDDERDDQTFVQGGVLRKPARYGSHPVPCPYGQPGDRLWVREAHAIVPRTAYRASTGVHQVLRPDDDHDAAVFRADWERSAPSRWKPSIHMPRWACRLVLEIVRVRVERLQDISRGDAMEEGCPFPNMAKETDPVEWFRELWSGINGADSWAANPWVWVVEFRRVQP